jgi:hypothetical protein
VPAENNCTGTGPSVLAQIIDKKVKLLNFSSTEGTTATAAPAREKNAQILENHLCQAPASVSGNKPINCSTTTVITRAEAEQRIRDCGQTTIHLTDPSPDEVGSGADVNADGDDPHWPARAPDRLGSDAGSGVPVVELSQQRHW